MAEKLNVSSEKLRWVCFEFTSEEDLLLISSEGVIYQIDPKSGEFLDKKPPTLGIEFSQGYTGGNILDAKLYADNNNLLVFRNGQN